jgi:hypothetical protein
MFAWAGNQKAWFAAFGALVSTLVIQMTTGQPVGVENEVGTIADLAAAAAKSGVAALGTYVITWMKANIS